MLTFHSTVGRPRYLQAVLESSIPAVLRERASLRPNETAFTFIDYEQDWAGVAETLTWSQVYRRTLTSHSSSGLAGQLVTAR